MVSIQVEIIERLKRLKSPTETADKLLLKLEQGVRHATEGRDLAAALATKFH